MKEVDLFKLNYFQGRLILVRGPRGTRKIRMVYELLKRCQVHEREVTVLDASTFSDQFVGNISSFLLQGIRVFLVNRLESLSSLKHEAFLRALHDSRLLFFAYGVRVVLISSGEAAFDRQLMDSVPLMRIQVRGCQDNLDERVHGALELACRITQKRVTHLSESAANFLEIAGSEIQDDGLLQALVYAVRNCTQGVLKRDDFFKSGTFGNGPRDDAATCCN